MGKSKKLKKKTINLWDYYWQVLLASQRLALINKILSLDKKRETENDVFDWIMDWREIKVDENGEFETSSGRLTIRGWKDEKGKQYVDFYFDLASN